MDITLYLAFLLVAFWVIVIPGPNILVIVSTSIACGKKRGVQTAAGTATAMAIQLMIVGAGTSWLVDMIAGGLVYLKWAGIIYLAYLGAVHIRKAFRAESQLPETTTFRTFSKGFLISLSNPKTMLFFSAFFPQFISPAGPYELQMLSLCVSFWVMATCIDMSYALLAAKVPALVRSRALSRFQDGVSGTLFFGAGAWLASLNRTP